MTDVEQRNAAARFAEDWKGRGDEKQETQAFWLALLQKVYGVEEPEKYISLPPELRRAHQQNDKAVMLAYGFSVKDMTESKCVAELMKMYQQHTAENQR